MANPLYKVDKQGWIEIGLQTLAMKGWSMLDITSLAKKLRATKGSFYWHFETKRQYELCLYSAFEDRALESLQPTLGLNTDNLSSVLAERFLNIPQFEIRLELAIREWARRDPTIFRKCSELDRRRLQWLSTLLNQSGVRHSEIKASQVFALTVGYGLIPEFLGEAHKEHYTQALDSILSR